MTLLAAQKQADRPDRGDGGAGGAASAQGHGRKRLDIEGLRAIAILLVLPYHAGLALFPGGFIGVDVFFVISGFVITRQLLKEVDRTGTVSLLGFYARRAKRLLPASGLVLVATAAMVWLWVPKIRWEVIGGDIVASSLYVVNWRLAERSVDYLAEDVTPSPVQHFWSLAVEEQYYFVWPLFIIIAVWAARRLRVSRMVALCVGLLLVAVPSLAWAVYQSVADPERGYFVTTTRMWELALGAFVALFASQLAGLPRRAALALAWLGVALVLVGAWTFSAATDWPGAYALVPTVGTALVIAAGEAAGPNGPVRFLQWRTMQFLGALSYSLYLWHWPLIIVARERFGDLSALEGLAIGAFSIVPAYLSYKLLEDPIRNAKGLTRAPRAAVSLGANFTLVGVAAGLALLVAFGSVATTAPTDADGAAALASSPTQAQPTRSEAGKVVDTVEGGITPNPLQAPEDVPDLYDKGCQIGVPESEPVVCDYGPEDAETTIAVVGDSKAAQWVPAFQVLAEKNGWRVRTYTKSACTFTSGTIAFEGEPWTACHDFGQKVLDRLTGDEQVDVVVTSGMRRSAITGEDGGELQGSEQAMVDGLTEAWERLTEVGTKVVVLADTPRTSGDVYACVAENTDRLSACAFDREKGSDGSAAAVQKRAAEALGAVDLTDGADRQAAADEEVFYLDLLDWYCPTEECPPVIGNVLVWRQGSHLTKTYVESLAPRLEQALLTTGVRA